MRTLHIVVSSTALLFAGCKQIDGTYYPGCVVLEGDKIVLSEGNVTWDRFTDRVILDADGNEMDPFPEFPKTGTYEVDGELLHLNIAAGEVQKTLHIRHLDERVMLLNAGNLAEWERTGQYDDCVLTLGPEEVP